MNILILLVAVAVAMACGIFIGCTCTKPDKRPWTPTLDECLDIIERCSQAMNRLKSEQYPPPDKPDKTIAELNGAVCEAAHRVHASVVTLHLDELKAELKLDPTSPLPDSVTSCSNPS